MTTPVVHLIFSVFLVLATSRALGQSIHAEQILAARDPSLSVQQFCSSVQFNVEVKNLITGYLVPGECVTHIKKYTLRGQYDADVLGVVNEARAYVRSLGVQQLNDADILSVVNEARAYARNLGVQGVNKAWIFDIDETTLSNVPYYEKHSFGSTPYNSTQFNAWVNQASAPPLRPTLALFSELVAAKWKVIFLTGRPELQRQVTIKNLLAAGYRGWEKLILKNSTFPSAESYKSNAREQLVREGYKIYGNIGDQWSDISGAAAGERTFKLPNPLYFIP